MHFIINLNKNYHTSFISFVKLFFMISRLRLILFFCHFLLLGVLTYYLFQGVDAIQEKGIISLLIFITLNLIRLLQQGDKTDSNDQL
jgi:hypothetical protein